MGANAIRAKGDSRTIVREGAGRSRFALVAARGRGRARAPTSNTQVTRCRRPALAVRSNAIRAIVRARSLRTVRRRPPRYRGPPSPPFASARARPPHPCSRPPVRRPKERRSARNCDSCARPERLPAQRKHQSHRRQPPFVGDHRLSRLSRRSRLTETTPSKYHRRTNLLRRHCANYPPRSSTVCTHGPLWKSTLCWNNSTRQVVAKAGGRS